MPAKVKTPGAHQSLVQGDGNKLLVCDRATVEKIVAMRQEAPPIIIVREQRAAAVAQLKCWVGQRVANAETGKRWSNATVGNVAAHRIEC